MGRKIGSRYTANQILGRGSAGTVWLGEGPEGPVAIKLLREDLSSDQELVSRFVQERTHHLLAAYIDDAPVGFVSGVEMTHPDKGTEMFLYELGVDDAARRQGIGTALVRALATKARDLGCQGMWVLTDEDNVSAQWFYGRAGFRRSAMVPMRRSIP